MAQDIRTYIRRIPVTVWGLLFAATSAAVLLAVFISQYFFNMHPCILCIYQRYPYGLALLLGLAIALFGARRPKLASGLLWVLGLTFIASFALSLFHLGVEYKWWTFNSACSNTSLYRPGASLEEMKEALRNASTVRCDDRVIFLFGMTMAFYNVLLSAGLSVASLATAWAYRSSSLSQYR